MRLGRNSVVTCCTVTFANEIDAKTMGCKHLQLHPFATPTLSASSVLAACYHGHHDVFKLANSRPMANWQNQPIST